MFPHLSVFDNVAFGLKLRKVDNKEIDKRVNEILEVVALNQYAKRLPKELSGGQRQRVALARALVIKPDLLLFDEPLSNLDAKLRVQMRVEIRRIQQELKITTVYVTHDQEECFSISDKVAVMNKGVIEQLDSPQNIYKNPSTEFVAKFVGFENFINLNYLNGTGEKKIFVANQDSIFEVANESISKEMSIYKGAVRPDDIEIIKEGDKEKTNIIAGTIGISTFLGKQYQYVVDTELGKLLVNGDANNRLDVNAKVLLHLPKEKIILV